MDDPSITVSSPIDKRQGANLPHWSAKNATYFVTFRLADSLPQQVVEAFRKERELLLAALHDTPNIGGTPKPQRRSGVAPVFPSLNPLEIQRLHQVFSEKIERYLDSGVGSCHMNRPKIADLVQNALLFFHAQRYALMAWAVMPNHVHVVFHPEIPWTLSEILHSWKSFTAKEANKLLVRSGAFWQAESYDHLIRSERDFRHCVDYTLNNPVRAGMKHWRWSGMPADHRRDADAT